MLKRIFSGRAAAALAAATLASSLLLGLLVPIYTDEVAWRFLTRAAVDGGVDRALWEHCGPHTIVAPPLFMLPLRHLSAAANSTLADPLLVRVTGVGLALAWAALLWLLAGRIARGSAEADRLRAIGFSLLGLGVLPLLLVLSRPEQPLLICITLAVLVASRRWVHEQAEDDGRGKALMVSAVILLLGLIAVGYHLKGILYAPLFALAIAIASRGPQALLPRIAATAVLGLGLITALQYWVGRFECSGDPVIAAQLAKENVASFLLGRDLLAGLSAWAAIDSHALSPARYVDLASPATTYMSDWLPPQVIGTNTEMLWATGVRMGWLLAVAGTALASALALPSMIRQRRVEPRFLIGITFSAIVLSWSLVQINKNSYEASLALPAVVMAMMTLLAAAAPPPWLLGLLDRIGRVLVILAVASQAAMFAWYGPALWRAASTRGYLDDQPFSYSPYAYRSLEREIVRAGKVCGIDRGRASRSVLIDDLTYFAYIRSWRPLHRLGVLQSWNGSLTDPVAYLRSKESAGIVMGCAYLPPQLRSQARQTGQFCCISLGK